jgi:light-regulated signal transduction histidine kinase (bacteriophytochrome)
MVDGSQQVQLFPNLIENAIKFRGDEVPRIHISATRGSTFVDNNSRPENTHHDTGVFAVRDNGIGLEPEFFERIFTIFQRLHSRDEYAGTGIGLAVCKKIVERHGGRMGGIGTGKRYDIFLFNTSSWTGERNEEREIAQEMWVYPTNILSQRTFAIYSVARGFYRTDTTE